MDTRTTADIQIPFPPAYYLPHIAPLLRFNAPQNNEVIFTSQDIDKIFEARNVEPDIFRTSFMLDNKSLQEEYRKRHSDIPRRGTETNEISHYNNTLSDLFQSIVTASNNALSIDQVRAIYAFALSFSDGNFIQGGLLRSFESPIQKFFIGLTDTIPGFNYDIKIVRNSKTENSHLILQINLNKKNTVDTNANLETEPSIHDGNFSYSQEFHLTNTEKGKFKLTLVSNEFIYDANAFEKNLLPSIKEKIRSNTLSGDDLFFITPCLINEKTREEFFMHLLLQPQNIQHMALTHIDRCFSQQQHQHHLNQIRELPAFKFLNAKKELHDTIKGSTEESTIAKSLANTILLFMNNNLSRNIYISPNHYLLVFADIMHQTTTGIKTPDKFDFESWNKSMNQINSIRPQNYRKLIGYMIALSGIILATVSAAVSYANYGALCMLSVGGIAAGLALLVAGLYIINRDPNESIISRFNLFRTNQHKEPPSNRAAAPNTTATAA